MYGLLCENLRDLIISKHGEDMWNKVRELARLKSQCFVLHSIYDENTIARIVEAYTTITGDTVDDIMHQTGVNFVRFVQRNGYNQLLHVLGRNFRDFLNGLDSLHEYLRFSYTKLRAPSFFVEKETAAGMVLHYASKRLGFLHYVVGQIKEVGKEYYDIAVDVEVLEYDENKNGCHVVLDLLFDNKDYVAQQVNNDLPEEGLEELNLDTNIFFDIFPFYIFLDKELVISGIGIGLRKVMVEDEVIGKKMPDVFDVIRPTFEFTWENLLHTNVLFEVTAKNHHEVQEESRNSRVHLKGNMMFISSLESMLFLASPVLGDLKSMSNMGVYVNDLALHDASRDLALHFLHESGELKIALDRERSKSMMLEESVQSLDIERKRADSLLYRMIPKQIADRLRKGDSTLNTCETFENVTILFSDVVGFTKICTKISPMEVVTMLNSMYMKFDQLSVQCGVYKVETIGDGYMLVSGIPVPAEKHADNVAKMALEMMRVIKSIPNPADKENDGHLEIRTGIHSGMVVAGVVGMKMPRYCLFGDTVNLASKMESSGSPNASHISETTKNALTEDKYCTIYRGNYGVKDIFMETHWLLGRKEDCSAANIMDHIKNLPIGCQFPKSRENSPVYISASQKLLTPKDFDSLILSGDEVDDMTSPSSYSTHSAYLEIEQYIIEHNLAIFSDESGTTTTNTNCTSLDGYSLPQGRSSTRNTNLSSNSFKGQSEEDLSQDSGESAKATNQKKEEGGIPIDEEGSSVSPHQLNKMADGPTKCLLL